MPMVNIPLSKLVELLGCQRPLFGVIWTHLDFPLSTIIIITHYIPYCSLHSLLLLVIDPPFLTYLSPLLNNIIRSFGDYPPVFDHGYAPC